MWMGRKVEGGRDKDNFLLPYFNLDVQGLEFSRVEAFIHMTEPEFVKVNVEQVTVSVLKCYAF